MKKNQHLRAEPGEKKNIITRVSENQLEALTRILQPESENDALPSSLVNSAVNTFIAQFGMDSDHEIK